MNGRLATLNLFVDKSRDKSLPFFKVLKAKIKFEWKPKGEKAF